jgi:conjugal transfer mating pair stabilization protein TraG
MDFVVYSFGGAELLWKCFNGVALVFQTPYFYSLSAFMVGVGLLVVAARAVPGGSFPILFKSWIMPTFFLTAFFWGPKVSINIIDMIDPDFKYARVDNIPLGLAMAASFSSRISEVLTETIETVITSSDQERFSKVGPMFAARLVHEATNLTIRDPLMRENLKDFTRQCFAWPYVFSNIEPGKKAALESEDMLGFIEANPHPGLGIYWRQGSGDPEFLDCGKCAAKVREVIPLEVDIGFESLAKSIFGTKVDGSAQTRRLKQYFGDAWQFLAKGSSDASKVVQQELMLNSYRSALQDKREEFGLGRANAQMAYVNAERGQVYQDASFLVKSALAGSQMPTLHTMMFAVALIFFTMVAPFTLMSGGLSLVMNWVKVMGWLATWPPLFAILNALGHMFAAKATSYQLLGYGEGLNLMTQNGLSDAAYHAYCFVMGLQYSVPFVSWALISSGGGYALSQFSSFLTQGGESFASKAASEMVDGNVSFDSQTLHYRSVANTQLAQQQLGASFQYGSRFDDGKLMAMYGTQGQQTFQEHQIQMGTNVSQNDALSSLLGLQSQDAYNSALSDSKSAGKQTQLGTHKTFSLLEGFSTAKGFTETFGNSDNSNVQKSFSDAVGQVKQFARAHSLSNEDAFNLFLNTSIEAGADFGTQGKGGRGKALGGNGAAGFLGTVTAGAKASLGSQYQASVKNSDSLSKNINAAETQKFATNFSQALNFLDDNKASIGDSLTTQKMDQIQWHFNEGDHYQDQAAANFQKSKMYSESASMQRQRGVSSSRNLNEEVLGHMAQERFGGDMYQAAQEAVRNPKAYQQDVSRQIDSYQSPLRPEGLESKEAVARHFESAKQGIKSPPSQNSELETGKMYAKQDHYELEARIDAKREETDFARSLVNAAASVHEGIDQNLTETEQEFKEESEKWGVTRAWNRLWK